MAETNQKPQFNYRLLVGIWNPSITFLSDFTTNIRYTRDVQIIYALGLSRRKTYFCSPLPRSDFSETTQAGKKERQLLLATTSSLQCMHLRSYCSPLNHCYLSTGPVCPVLSSQRHFTKPFSELCVTSTTPTLRNPRLPDRRIRLARCQGAPAVMVAWMWGISAMMTICSPHYARFGQMTAGF